MFMFYSVVFSVLVFFFSTGTDHDAAGQVVEDGRFQLKVLPSDDGVRHGELKEERLEDGERFTGSQAKSLRRYAESLRLPGGNGVWDS